MLSSAKKRYLLAIYELGEQGNEVHSKDIANALKVKRPSTSKMLKALSEEELIDKEYYGTVRFTPRGAQLANQLYTRYLLLNSFFQTTLQTDAHSARHDAILCLCELSDSSIEKLSSIVLTG